MSNVSGIVKSIRGIMRKDKGTYGDVQRLEQLGWMFFLKIFDDREQEMELLNDNYQSPISKDLRWSNWATDQEGITGDELLEFINNNLLKNLKELKNTGNPIISLIKNAFEDATNYMKNGTLLRQVINKVNEIDFNSSDDRHLFGDIYEKLLSELQSAGDAGEFYTPRAVTEFIVDRVNPELHEKILDPACGTGGFLVNVIEHLRKKATSEDDQKLLQEAFKGIEKKHLPYILCMTNLLLHGIDIPNNVKSDNTLARPLISWGMNEKVDVIVTNPPFGGIEEDGIEKGFGEFKTKETADLFLVLMMRLLKNHGRAGLVLPDGTLFGEGVKTRIKEALLKDCNLHTIVRLPESVFAPYTLISTNLLFFTKGKPTKEIWYYEHKLPKDTKAYNKTKPIKFKEFQPIQDWWGSEDDGFQSRVETDYAWKVSIEEIILRDFNLDISNPFIVEQINQDPKELKALYDDQNQKIKNLRNELKAKLKKALNIDATKIVETWQQIQTNFDTLFTTEKSIDQLKQVILQLALMGKVVPQNQIDESASELLDRIAKEKSQLLIQKKIKKQRVFPPVAPDEEPYNVPTGWKWSRLGTICTKLTDGSHNPPPNSGKGYPMLSSQNIHSEKIDFLSPSRYLNEKDFLSEDKRTAIKPFDVLLNIVASIGRSAVVPLDAPKFALQRSVAVLTSSLDPFYLKKVLSSSLCTSYYATHAKGTAQKGIYLGKLGLMPLPVPPLSEQKQIVAKVDELFSLCDQLKESVASAKATKTTLTDNLVDKICR